MGARKRGWWIANHPHWEFSAKQPFRLKAVSIDAVPGTDTLPDMSVSTFPRASLLAAAALAAGCNLITGAGDLVVEPDEPSAQGGGGRGGAGGGTGGPAATTGAGAAGGGATTATTGAGAGTSSSSHASSSAASSSQAASSSAASSSSSSGSTDPFDAAAQLCVDTINMYRATLGLPPYARVKAEEACGGQEAQKDSQTMTAHSAFGMCGEWAQNECPGWPGPPGSMITGCLQMMWNEGPGAFNQGHGHYLNMSSTMYTKVWCGFYVLPDGSVWATQDFQ
jgi:hypothetical protein